MAGDTVDMGEGGGSRSQAILTFSMHMGFDDPKIPAKDPTVGSCIQTVFVSHDFNTCPWDAPQERNHHRNAATCSISEHIAMKKSHPYPCKNTHILLAWKPIQKSPNQPMLSRALLTWSSQCFCCHRSCAAKTAFHVTAAKSIGKDRSDLQESLLLSQASQQFVTLADAQVLMEPFGQDHGAVLVPANRQEMQAGSSLLSGLQLL